MSNNQLKPTEYEKYLAVIHAKLVTPDEILNAVVKEATGLIPLSKRKIVAGEANEVYDVLLSNNHHVIVRISRSEKPDFEQEKWAITQCKNIKIPVPEIYIIKHLRYNKKLLSICVQQKIDGDTLERGAVDYHDLDRDYVREIIVKAGETLSKIHSIKTHNFGYLNGKGEGNFKSFADLMSEHVHQVDEFYRIANKIDLNTESVSKIFEVLNNNLK